MRSPNTIYEEEQEAINKEKPQESADTEHASFDHEPQKDTSNKGEQRDLLAETLDKWETFQAQQRHAGRTEGGH
jgi:hypothetical protein